MLIDRVPGMALRQNPRPLGALAAAGRPAAVGAGLGQQDIAGDDTGYGYGPEQLAAFTTPDAAALLDYAAEALTAANRFLTSIGDAELDGMEVINPRGGTMTLANMCQQLLWEFNQHGGQIAYLRGMQRGLENPLYSGGLLEGLAAREAGNG